MKAKTIMYFFPKGATFAQETLFGVKAVASKRGWNFFTVETERLADGSLRLERASQPADSLPTLAKILQPDGVIVWHDALNAAEAESATGPGVPSVFIYPLLRSGSAHASEPSSRNAATGCVFNDPETIASMAARELLLAGCTAFAYVPASIDEPWNTERGEAFARDIGLTGKPFFAFDPKRGPLGRFLLSLPKPCGVFAANDIAGEKVLDACAVAAIPVPQDVAVVGVDDFAYICENTSPTLSSVAQDSLSEGRAAAVMLAEWMERPDRPPPSRYVAARRLVRRASSHNVRDRRVASALELIRLHACDPEFGPLDAVREMDVSRSLACRRFRLVTGRTIIGEIHAVRIERAKDLLMQGRPPDMVAADCGYASIDDFRRVFRRLVGTTPRRWVMAAYSKNVRFLV